MHFTGPGVAEFLRIFDESQVAIRNFPGCTHLELLKDAKDPECYTTLSHWVDDQSLENYRRSALFDRVWTRVKPLFSGRTEAFSLHKFIEV
jgi:heme oxygenase (mycobilin-producing)